MDLGTLPDVILLEMLYSVRHTPIFKLRLLNKRMNSLILNNLLHLNITKDVVDTQGLNGIGYINLINEMNNLYIITQGTSMLHNGALEPRKVSYERSRIEQTSFYKEQCKKVKGLTYNMSLNYFGIIQQFSNISILSLYCHLIADLKNAKKVEEFEFPYLKNFCIDISGIEYSEELDYFLNLPTLFNVENATIRISNTEANFVMPLLSSINPKKIKNLDISYMRSLNMYKLEPFICSFINLESLEISGCLDFNPSDSSNIIIKSNNNKIKEIKLNGYCKEVSPNGLSSLRNWFLRDMIYKPTLEKLSIDIGGNKVNNPDNPLLYDFNPKNVRVNDNIKYFSFIANNDILNFKLERFTGLEEVHIECKLFFEESLKLILKLNNVSTVRFSDIHHNAKKGFLYNIIRKKNKIKKLFLHDCFLNLKEFLALIYLFSNLTLANFKYGSLDLDLIKNKYNEDIKRYLDRMSENIAIYTGFIKAPLLLVLDNSSCKTSVGNEVIFKMFENNKNVNIWKI